MAARTLAARLGLTALLGLATLLVTGAPGVPPMGGVLRQSPHGLSLPVAISALACWTAIGGLAAGTVVEWLAGRGRSYPRTALRAIHRALLVALVGTLVLIVGVLRVSDTYHVCCADAHNLQEATHLAR